MWRIQHKIWSYMCEKYAFLSLQSFHYQFHGPKKNNQSLADLKQIFYFFKNLFSIKILECHVKTLLFIIILKNSYNILCWAHVTLKHNTMITYFKIIAGVSTLIIHRRPVIQLTVVSNVQSLHTIQIQQYQLFLIQWTRPVIWSRI